MSKPPRYSEFAQEMSRQLDDLSAKSDVAGRVRARILASPRTLPEARSRARRTVALLAAAAALGLLLLLRPHRVPLRAYLGEGTSVAVDVGSWINAAESETSLLRFSDSAEVLLEPSGSAKVLAIDEKAVRLALDHGRARVSVVPSRGADYRIDAGPFQVHVTGTRFQLAWDPAGDRFELVLHEGRVVLSGCVFGASFAVHAGQQVIASCRDRKLEVKPTAETPLAEPMTELTQPVAASASLGEERATVSRRAQPAAAKPSASSPNTDGQRWLALARRGDRQQAWAQVKGQGIEKVIQHATPEELILLGDTARDVGELGLAARIYETVRHRAPASHSAAVAAFALGRLEFDNRGAYAASAAWFSAYLNEEPQSGLAREARGRLMEALHRAGNESSARQVAAEYLRLFPQGPHAELATRLTRSQDSHR